MRILGFLPRNIKSAMLLIFILAYFNLNNLVNMNVDKSKYIFYFIPHTLIIMTILLVFFVINTYFKRSKNRLVLFLKNFEFNYVYIGIITFSSISFIYDLFFRFNNADSFILLFFTLVHILFLIFGLLASTVGYLAWLFKMILAWFGLKRHRKKYGIKKSFFMMMIPLNLIYLYGIKDKNKYIKLINIVGYSLFIICLLGFLMTFNQTQTTQGEINGLGFETRTFYTAYKLQFIKHYLIQIDTQKGEKEFRIKENEYEKCDWKNTKIVKLNHHIFWHSSIYNNNILYCG